MAEIIHRDDHPYDLGPRWVVIQDPTMAGRPDLVRFLKCNATRKLLDQTARWTGAGWDGRRWVPRIPRVPKTLLLLVECHMRGLV